MRTQIFYQFGDSSIMPAELWYKECFSKPCPVAKFIVTEKIALPETIKVIINLRDGDQCPCCRAKNCLYALGIIPYNGATEKDPWNILCSYKGCTFNVRLIGADAFSRFQSWKYDKNGQLINK